MRTDKSGRQSRKHSQVTGPQLRKPGTGSGNGSPAGASDIRKWDLLRYVVGDPRRTWRTC
jgi:hypothetical protein